MDISLCFLLLAFLYFLTTHFLSKFQNLPPTPSISLPLIGHLYLIKKPLHRSLANISHKHGPVLFLKFGSRPVLLVSSPSAVEQCFTKNDVVLANRPRLLAGKYLGYDYTTLSWASYGHHWRNLRRIASMEILSAHRIQAFADIRRDEVRSLIKRLHRDSGYQAVDMKSAFFELTMNILMVMIARKRHCGGSVRFLEDYSVWLDYLYLTGSAEELEQAKKFRAIVAETFQVSGATNISDFVPIVKWFRLNKIEDKLRLLKEKRDNFMQELIEEHKQTRRRRCSDDRRNKTMTDVLLSLQYSEPEYYTDEIIKGMGQVMLSAGTGTTVATMEWALSLLLNNPEALKRGQIGIDIQTGGSSTLIEESDLPKLPYLHGIINETLRMYPTAPVLVPHESSEDCVIEGFRVPKGTMLLANLWAIQNDPKLWEEPQKFIPERLWEIEGQRDGFKQMPFGYGRRGCPGESMAMHVAGLALGTLIQCFEWERDGEELVNMSEGPGLTMPRGYPLLAKCRPIQGRL